MSGTTVSPWAVAAAAIRHRLPSLVRCVAFWTAALLPFVYLPLVALEPSRLVDFRLLGAMVSVNLVALVVGHGHYATDESAEGSAD